MWLKRIIKKNVFQHVQINLVVDSKKFRKLYISGVGVGLATDLTWCCDSDLLQVLSSSEVRTRSLHRSAYKMSLQT